MGEFSAHRVTIGVGERILIATAVDLYVATYGDDVLNSGVEPGSPFKTLARAFEWLSDKYISDFGFVTINVRSGIYDVEDSLIFDHPQGSRVAIIGAEPETLLLQYVSNYRTTGFTADGYAKYYTGVKHGITMTCVRPSDSTVYASITSGNAVPATHGISGAGVLIEDYDLVYREDYNPAYYYASYPFHPRNNIVRQGSILGCHKLTGITLGTLAIESSIRDDWFCIPAGTSMAWGRMYGNPQIGVSYINGSCANPQDTSELQTNSWFLDAYTSTNVQRRGHYLSNVPVGYYGTNATTGIPVGATANIVGSSFPSSSLDGKTATYIYQGITATGLTGWYTSTGPAGSFLNDAVNFGKNYHEHNPVNGISGIGGSGSWGSVNSNRITVKLIPTVLRRFGNILTVKNGGLRKIKNVFFDGMEMPSHYNLIGAGSRNVTSGYSNKAAITITSAKVGYPVINEPTSFGDGLCTNVGVKDFHVGTYINDGSNANLGKVVASNCSYGLITNNKSTVYTEGSVCTGMGAVGFGSFNASTLVANRCFAAFSGQSLVALRMKGATAAFQENSFIHGQTYTTPDNKIKGTVWDWDAREKMLYVAVRVGALESGSPIN
jgi:hypothetical protein